MMKKLFSVLATFMALALLLTAVCAVSAGADVTEQTEEAQPTATATATGDEPKKPGFLKGDANNDGLVNVKDLLTLRKFIADIPTDINLDAADINHDGYVNMKDALELRTFIAYDYTADELTAVDFTVEERVFNVGGSEEFCDTFPKAAILRSSEDVNNLFAAAENSGRPKKTYDDAFFKDKFLLALRVSNGYVDDNNTVPVVYLYGTNNNAIVLHVRLSECVSPWTVQDMVLLSLPLSVIDHAHWVYEFQEIPLHDSETGAFSGYSFHLKDVHYTGRSL